jgi:hypothetical protein
LGKLVFGGAYGAGVFGLYGLLGWLGAPQFYDKLLCVPLLNLTVRALDGASLSLEAWFRRQKISALEWAAGWSPQQANFAWMGVWIALFGTMTFTGFLGGKQPGSSPAFWMKACEEGRWHACRTLAHSLDVACQNNSGPGCFSLGMLLNGGKEVPRNPTGAARSFSRGCDLGLPYSCISLASLVNSDGSDLLAVPCQHGDVQSCLTLGLLYQRGQGVARNDASALALFREACASGSPRGCGLVGESYLFGQGTPVNRPGARVSLEKACELGDAPSCYNTGLMYRLGEAVPKDEMTALKRFGRACDLGFRLACRAKQEIPALPATAALPQTTR